MTALLTRELVTYPAREVKVHLLSGFLSLYEGFSDRFEGDGMPRKTSYQLYFLPKRSIDSRAASTRPTTILATRCRTQRSLSD